MLQLSEKKQRAGLTLCSFFEYPKFSFKVAIPFIRAINYVTNTDWEGVGVIPNKEVSADSALDVALIMALESVRPTLTDENHMSAIDFILDGVKYEENPVGKLDNEQMARFVGTYGPRAITMEERGLFYQRGTGNKYQLQALSQDTFKLKDKGDDFRLRFVENEKGMIVGVTGLYRNGRRDYNERN